MIMATQKLATTALLFGAASVVLLVLPFILYAAKFNDPQKRTEGMLKNVGEVVFLHVFAFIIILIGSSAIDSLMMVPDFKPSKGIEYFYAMSESGTPWEAWFSKTSASMGTVGGKEGELMSAFLAVFVYVMLLVFLLYLIIPIALLWATFASIGNENMIREYSAGQSTSWQDYITYGATAAFRFIGVMVIALFHMELASLYVATLTGSGFSHYGLMSDLWNNLLLG